MPFSARLTLPLALAASAPALAAKPQPVHITATEVVFKNAKQAQGPAISDALRTASTQEAAYYDAALKPVTMRIAIDKVGFKSGGKALAANLPLVGMFAGANRNLLKGQVEIVDQASGKVLNKYKIQCDDDTSMSAADGALTLASTGLSFLPFGGLISAAMDVAQGAANNRDAAEQMLTRGFVMLSYKQVYGEKLYRSFAHQRKAAFELAKAEKAKVAPAATAPAATAAPEARVAAATPVAR